MSQRNQNKNTYDSNNMHTMSFTSSFLSFLCLMSSKLQNKGPVCKITFGNMRQSQTVLYTLYINMFFVSMSAYIIEIYNTEVPDLAYFFA